MGFDNGRIILDSKNDTYYAGQTIFGKLEFQQDKVKTFRGIYVKIKGFAHNHWTTRHSRTVNKKTQYYTVNHDAHEEYFSTKQYLVGDENGEHHLQPGNYSYDFQCHIPAHCPASFEHPYGHIRYRVKVVVDKAFKFDQEKEKHIRVIAPLDLNQYPNCKEPVVLSFEDTYCSWCVSAGFSETIAKLPMGGYCSGQVIPVELHCANKSNVKIKKIKLAIIQKMKFTAHHKPDTKHVEESVIEIKKGPIAANTTRNWTVEIEVPAIDIYNVESCKIIDIHYEFKVKSVSDGCHENSSDTRTIVLGTIPLVGYQDDVPNPLQDQMPMLQHIDVNKTPQFGSAISPYPPANSYLGTDSHSTVNPTFPNHFPQYPTVTPYPLANPPFPNPAIEQKVDDPYPDAPPPYPATDSTYPDPNPGLGFRVQGMTPSHFPQLPYTITSGTVAPSAPAPSSPDDDSKLSSGEPKGEDISGTNNYPYNPDFGNSEPKK